MDTDSFIVHVKSEDIYTDLADYVLKNIWHNKLWRQKAITHREKQKEGRIDEGWIRRKNNESL